MTTNEINELLARSLDDHRLSRNERKALEAGLESLDRAEYQGEVFRRAFELAREQQGSEGWDWLEAVLKALLREPRMNKTAELTEAHFSPGEHCPRRIGQLFGRAVDKVDVCVFTITDDLITSAIIDAHRRGVAIRIITDNDKANDEGSDIVRLDEAGIPVRVDRTEYHMHHKFTVFDDSILLTGSYNWTRGAARFNNENFIVTTEQRLISPFATSFERLWDKLA